MKEMYPKKVICTIDGVCEIFYDEHTAKKYKEMLIDEGESVIEADVKEVHVKNE